MKILIYSDVHWCEYSSIVRKRGEKYSQRLENLIKSVNWAENLAVEQSCQFIVCNGDFFDSSSLNHSEITALNEIKWAPMDHYMIVGNHEMGTHDLSSSSAHLFAMNNELMVINKPTVLNAAQVEICLLPYILESERKPSVADYFEKTNKKRLLLMHNDIAGIQMGQFISKIGFSIDDIEANCTLCINGHLHNGEKVSNKIINIGNLTGQNFSEDATKYDHCAFIVDTDTLRIEVYENPFAFNFYKVEWGDKCLNNLKDNAVVSIKADESQVSAAKEFIKAYNKIVEGRVTLKITATTVNTEDVQESFSVDHLFEFKKYFLEKYGSSEVILDELNRIC